MGKKKPSLKTGPPQRLKTKAPAPTAPVGGRQGLVKSASPWGKPDWNHWIKLDLWTLGEAVCLICNCDPEKLEIEAHPLRYSSRFSSRFYEDSKSKDLRQTYQIAVTAIKAGKLKLVYPWGRISEDIRNEIEPSQFITWAKSKGFIIPDEIEGLTKQNFLHSDTVNKNFGIPPGQQLALIDAEKLDPYERVQGDTQFVFPSMQPNAPDPYPKDGLPVGVRCEPSYKPLGKVECRRLTDETVSQVFYKESQVLELSNTKKDVSSLSSIATEQEDYALINKSHFWKLNFKGSIHNLKDTKGIQYIAKLLSLKPKTKIHVTDLLISA